MTDKVDIIITTFNQLGISSEYRVINPSKNPAAMVKGIVLKKILKLFLNPIFNECIREKVCGNKMEAPKINPAAASMTIPKISIEP